MATVAQILKEFFSLTLTVLPYFALGAVTGALLKTYAKTGWLVRHMSGNALSIFWASLAGAALPGCACATMPMAQGLVGKARLGTITAFIMISPLLSPVTLLLTYAMLGWEMTAARLFVPFVGSMSLGLLVNALEGAGIRGFATPAMPGSPVAAACGPACDPGCEAEEVRPNFFRNLGGILRDLTPYFLLGMGVAAVSTALLPENAIPDLLGGGSGPAAYALAAIVGIPLYVCEGEEVPITFALMQKGLGAGPAFTFLLASVGTCIPTILMAQKVIGRPATIVYVAAWIVFAVGAGVVFAWAADFLPRP
ncbi:MAG: permease [Nitrospirae bacterium]|nr:permease [Nitrospirota bacterium]